MKFEDSKTKENLLTAFSGESSAANRYLYYAEKARKDGYMQIAEFFEETAANERAHAKIWFNYLFGSLKDTGENLTEAANGENFEHTSMYPAFEEIAHDEGFDEIAEKFKAVAEIERSHEERFLKLCENVKKNRVFERTENRLWICRNCGHIHYGTKCPETCPVCNHPKAFFEIKNDGDI